MPGTKTIEKSWETRSRSANEMETDDKLTEQAPSAKRGRPTAHQPSVRKRKSPTARLLAQRLFISHAATSKPVPLRNPRRYAPGADPTARLNALLNAASES